MIAGFTREELDRLVKRDMSYAFIGRLLGVSKARVSAFYTKNDLKYQKSDKYKMYRRHMFHDLGSKPNKPCQYCKNRQ